jgi:hypothetical protein
LSNVFAAVMVHPQDFARPAETVDTNASAKLGELLPRIIEGGVYFVGVDVAKLIRRLLHHALVQNNFSSARLLAVYQWCNR